MRAPAGLILSLTLLAGCGGSSSGPDGAIDMSADLAKAAPDLHSSPDLNVPDFAVPPDLAAPPDLARPVDLRMLPVDFSRLPDAGGHGVCPANAGYAGMGGQCGQQGTCNNQTFALDCDGMTCVCSIDKVATNSYIQMPGSCNTLMQDWSTICGF